MVATLDSRTSSVCRSLDGRVFPVDSGPRPPFHINCRTSFVLVLKAEYAGREAQGKRASAGGAVSDGLSYLRMAGKTACGVSGRGAGQNARGVVPPRRAVGKTVRGLAA